MLKRYPGILQNTVSQSSSILKCLVLKHSSQESLFLLQSTPPHHCIPRPVWYEWDTMFLSGLEHFQHTLAAAHGVRCGWKDFTIPPSPTSFCVMTASIGCLVFRLTLSFLKVPFETCKFMKLRNFRGHQKIKEFSNTGSILK